jgi:hypothetical protein
VVRVPALEEKLAEKEAMLKKLGERLSQLGVKIEGLVEAREGCD